MERRKYGLFTAITMITGIVIGSGIFFKADDVLTYTDGNVILGIIIFFVAAIAIIFGSLAVSQLAMRTDKPGGLIAYAEEFVGKGTACAFGWFQTFFYMPSLAAVVSWVSGIYITQLFGWESNLEVWTLIGIGILVMLYAVNILSAKAGGRLQNASMIIKLIPLFSIAIIGMVLGEPGTVLTKDFHTIADTTRQFTWISAFAPIAFSFDGWIVSTSICHEIKNSKRNLPIALAVSPLIILIAYVSYFVGVSTFLGPDAILEHGDSSVFIVTNRLFGGIGAKAILIFVVISVVGTVNGIVLAFIRMPYSLALRHMIPGSRTLCKEDHRFGGIPFNSALLSFGLSVFWMVVHYVTQRWGMRGDVSEIAIGISYLNYIVLYKAIIGLARKGVIQSKWKGYVVPVIATLGSFIILSGSMRHPLFLTYLIVCGGMMVFSGSYYKKNRDRIS